MRYPPIRRVSDRVYAVDLLIRGGFMIRNSVMATLLLGHLLATVFGATALGGTAGG